MIDVDFKVRNEGELAAVIQRVGDQLNDLAPRSPSFPGLVSMMESLCAAYRKLHDQPAEA